jgi:flagellar biosynthesis anti-sigma factor FlgM
MRIQDTRSNFDAPITAGVESTRQSDVKAVDAKTEKTRIADEVHLSAGAQLANSVLEAAKQSPDVRVEVVERARKLLDAGQVGNDAGRLADKLIDTALGS